MELILTSLEWIVALFVIFGSLSFGLYMAYKRRAGATSVNFFLISGTGAYGPRLSLQ